MEIKDYLQNISESKLKLFLEKELGAYVKSIVKYYDESYNGFLFCVNLSGLDYLPREDNNTIRLGKYGLVKDDPSSVIPEILDDFGAALIAPNFFKKYVYFVNEMNRDCVINAKTYGESFYRDFSMFLLLDKIEKQKRIEDEAKQQAELLQEIKLAFSQEPEKE